MQDLSCFKLSSFTLNFKHQPNRQFDICAETNQGLKKAAFRCIICLLRSTQGKWPWMERLEAYKKAVYIPSSF